VIDSRSKLEFVDALRGLAILLVLIAHNYLGFLEDSGKYPSWFEAIVYQGVYGVQLFYIMSAFTLFLSLSYNKVGWIAFRNFFIRRLFRIVPLFYMAILYYSIKAFVAGEGYGIWQILTTITFTNGLSVEWINGIFFGSWSIAIEMPFYVLVPLLFTYIKNLNAAVCVFVITVIVARLMIFALKQTGLVLEPGFNEFLYFYLPAQLPVFSLGIILFFLVRSEDRSIKPVTVLALSILIITHYVLTGVITSFVLLSMGFLGFSYALFLLKPALFVNRFTVFIGKISFGVYLFHWAIFSLIKEFNLTHVSHLPVLNFFLRVIFIIILSIGLAYPMHLLVEIPFQNLGKRLIKKIST
jgi:peptidoglycan/LPS O-acetylase OafA/YrhL